MRRFLGAVIVSLLFVTNLGAKNLYVQTTGCNDSTSYANNSLTQPWCTLQRALCGTSASCASSSNAAEAAKAGDTVLVSPGVYTVGPATNSRTSPALNPVNSGTSSAPITIRRNGTGTVDIRQTNPNGERGPVFGVEGRDYIIWDGMFVQERDTENVSISDTGPFVLWSTTGSQLLNSEIVGSTLPSRNDNHPTIRLEYATNVLVKNNRAHGCNSVSGSGIQLYHSTNVTIENNEVWDTEIGIYPKGSNRDIVVRYNLVHVQGKAYDVSSALTCVTFHNNVAYSSSWGISLDGGLTCVNVVNNTFHNTKRGIVPYDNATWPWERVRWYNNLVTASPQSPFEQLDGIYATNLSSTSGGFADYNLVFGHSPFGSFQGRDYDKAGFVAATGWEANSLLADPLYVNASALDFRLRAGSPAINAGIDILDLDHDGQTNDPITMGAYITGNEVVGLTSGTPSTCGNGVIDAGEQCDGTNLNGQSCQSLGYSGGTLSCSYCSFNTAGCTVAPPSAPTGLQATAISYGQIDLRWTDTSSNETGFKIERKTGASGTYSQIGTATANVSNYQDTSVNATTTYFYRVRATNTGGDSAYSNEATATTPAGPDLNTGLAGNWKFDEGSGTIAQDSSGNAGTGSLINNPTWTSGRAGQALSFNGATTYVIVNDSAPLDIGAQGTIVVWIKRGSTGSWGSILSKGTANSNAAQNYALEFNPADQLEMKFGNGAQENVLIAPAIMDTANFHHVAFVWTGTQMISYLDGVQNASTAQTINPVANPAALLIGQFSADAGGSNQDPFSGIIDEIRIYNRALTSQEIQTLYNSVPISGQSPSAVSNVRRADSR